MPYEPLHHKGAVVIALVFCSLCLLVGTVICGLIF